jgi:hypothetical protein
VLFFERDISLNFLIIFYGVSDLEEGSQQSKNKLKKNVCDFAVFVFILVFYKILLSKEHSFKRMMGPKRFGSQMNTLMCTEPKLSFLFFVGSQVLLYYTYTFLQCYN